MSRVIYFSAFILFFNVALALLNSSGFFNVSVQADTEWFEAMDNTALQDQSYVQSLVNDVLNSLGALGDLFRSLPMMVSYIGRVIFVQDLYLSLGIPAPFNYFLAVPSWFGYGILFVQFLRGIGFKGFF